MMANLDNRIDKLEAALDPQAPSLADLLDRLDHRRPDPAPLCREPDEEIQRRARELRAALGRN